MIGARTISLVAAGLTAVALAAPSVAAGQAPDDDAPWVYTTLEGGMQSVDLTAFDADHGEDLSVGFVPIAGTGPMLAWVVGARLWFITLGARISWSSFGAPDGNDEMDDFDIWTFGGEAGVRFMTGRIEPSLVLGLGYATFGGLGDAISGIGRGLDLEGFDARATAGLDVFIVDWLSVGGRLGGDLLIISRSGVPLRQLASPEYVESIGDARARVLEADGASAGGAWSLTAAVGLHL